MIAMLLAAGRGTRLGSIGLSVPKVLVDIGDEPLLASQLRYLEREGVERVVINAHHLYEAVEAFAADYKGPLDLVIIVEPRLLGTAGGVRNALDHLGDQPVIVLYGDVVVRERLAPIVDSHRRTGVAATLTVYETSELEGKGTVSADEEGRVVAFAEKSTNPASGRALVNAGLYVVDPAFIAEIQPDVPSDFGHDVFPAALARGRPLGVYRLAEPVIDMGTPEGLARARAAQT